MQSKHVSHAHTHTVIAVKRAQGEESTIAHRQRQAQTGNRLLALNVAVVVIALSGSSLTVVGGVAKVVAVTVVAVAEVAVNVVAAVVVAHNLPFACLIIYLRCTFRRTVA